MIASTNVAVLPPSETIDWPGVMEGALAEMAASHQNANQNANQPPEDVPTVSRDHHELPGYEMPNCVGENSIDRWAWILRNGAGAAFISQMAGSMLFLGLDIRAPHLYCRQLIHDCQATDPLEAMFIEQMALAYFHVAGLQLKSTAVKSQKESLAYVETAIRLLGEFRRGLTALEDYRGKQVTRRLQEAALAQQMTTRDSGRGPAQVAPAGTNGNVEPSANGHGTAKNGNGSGKLSPTSLGPEGERLPQRVLDRVQGDIPGGDAHEIGRRQSTIGRLNGNGKTRCPS